LASQEPVNEPSATSELAPPPGEPKWLEKVKRTGPYALALVVGAMVAELGNLADIIGKSYDRLKTPEAFVLAENTAKSQFSDQLAQRAWRRIFWADNFRARVINRAPIPDIDASWKAYIDSDADWNANVMISIVGLDRYYGTKRSQYFEDTILSLFLQLDNGLAALRRSDTVNELRAGTEPTAAQMIEATALGETVKKTSDTLKLELYVLVRCFAPANRYQNLCE
jgi:hypothetical protein